MTPNKRTLVRLAIFLLAEALFLVLSLWVGHGRMAEVLAWWSGAQFSFAGLIALIVWVAKHRQKFFIGSIVSTRGKIILGGGALLVCAALVVWVVVVFPLLLRVTLRHYGTTASATVVDSHLVAQLSRGGEIEVSSPQAANQLNVTLAYANRETTLAIPKDDPAFKAVYGASTIHDGSVIVRYLPGVPAIVLPEADLQ